MFLSRIDSALGSKHQGRPRPTTRTTF